MLEEMKRFFGAWIFLSAFCLASFAQTDRPESCPQIDVRGPSGIVAPGETMTFTVNVTGFSSEKLVYKWTISTGEIVNGQGTPTITVKTSREFGGTTPTATVEISGLPKGCPATDSEATIWDPPPEARKIDEFSGSISRIETRRIDAITEAIENDPMARLYIIIGQKNSRIRDRKIKAISDLLVKKRRIDADRITIVEILSEEDSTHIFIVPPGASNPQIK